MTKDKKLLKLLKELLVVEVFEVEDQEAEEMRVKIHHTEWDVTAEEGKLLQEWLKHE